MGGAGFTPLLGSRRLHLPFPQRLWPWSAQECKGLTPHKLTLDALLPEPPSPPPIATTYWERAAQKLALVLQGQEAYWAGEPDANRLRVFARCIDEIRQQCADEGLEA